MKAIVLRISDDQVDENSATIKHASLINKFDRYCTPRTNETYERYVFYMTVQKHSTNLKIKAKSCNFGPLESSLVRDQIVVGVHDTKLKEAKAVDSVSRRKGSFAKKKTTKLPFSNSDCRNCGGSHNSLRLFILSESRYGNGWQRRRI